MGQNYDPVTGLTFLKYTVIHIWICSTTLLVDTHSNSSNYHTYTRFPDRHILIKVGGVYVHITLIRYAYLYIYRYIQHPVAIKALGGDRSDLPLPMYLTKKERKRIRKTARAEREQEKRDKMMMGKCCAHIASYIIMSLCVIHSSIYLVMLFLCIVFMRAYTRMWACLAYIRVYYIKLYILSHTDTYTHSYTYIHPYTLTHIFHYIARILMHVYSYKHTHTPLHLFTPTYRSDPCGGTQIQALQLHESPRRPSHSRP